MLNKLLNQSGKWLEGEGPYGDIVISSRIRIARNLKSHLFCHRAAITELDDIRKKIFLAASNNEYLKNSLLIEVDNLDQIDRRLLVERHLISCEHAEAKKAGLVLDPKEMISIMVNEEDHLRFQVLESGLKLMDAWRIAEQIESKLDTELGFAFSTDFGYITSCPTNVGTGLRASALVHLPALMMSNQITSVLKAVSQIHLAVRGFYGEGTHAIGNFYQVSNQVTLGHPEEEIINNIEMVTKQIIEHEKKARELLLETDRAMLEDNIYRSLGILSNARIISSKEVMNLLSPLRLGVDLDIIKDVSRKTLNQILIRTQPAHLRKYAGKELVAREADIKRAETVREIMNL